MISKHKLLIRPTAASIAFVSFSHSPHQGQASTTVKKDSARSLLLIHGKNRFDDATNHVVRSSKHGHRNKLCDVSLRVFVHTHTSNIAFVAAALLQEKPHRSTHTSQTTRIFPQTVYTILPANNLRSQSIPPPFTIQNGLSSRKIAYSTQDLIVTPVIACRTASEGGRRFSRRRRCHRYRYHHRPYPPARSTRRLHHYHGCFFSASSGTACRQPCWPR